MLGRHENACATYYSRLRAYATIYGVNPSDLIQSQEKYIKLQTQVLYFSFPLASGLYAGFFGGGGSIARNPFSRQLYAPPEAAPKFWELLTWKLSWVEDYRQSNTTSEA